MSSELDLIVQLERALQRLEDVDVDDLDACIKAAEHLVWCLKQLQKSLKNTGECLVCGVSREHDDICPECAAEIWSI